ncbi:hypothetical protein C470_14348 [Halorubrum distributum JCM 13561]|uniref:DUF8153 domain-containing protein n=1 Tax=Halorubrum distributum JCM 13561 TaxID=1227483 RepID=M0NK14_9EURY|nr:hypothetical protein [Halorubrum litoreum]EMA57454.1 hypothetical protein C470_14348 [Halorubrum litoreum JCM 13561]
MNRALRYGVALTVGLSVAGLVARFGNGDHLLAPSVFLIYAATTSLVVAHRGTWRTFFGTDPDRKQRVLGAVSGGVAGGATSAFVQISVPAATAAFGLMVFGMAITVADFTHRSESTPD